MQKISKVNIWNDYYYIWSITSKYHLDLEVVLELVFASNPNIYRRKATYTRIKSWKNFRLIQTILRRCPDRRAGVFCSVRADCRLLPGQQDPEPRVRRDRDNHLQSVHRVRHAAHGRGQPQVLAQPRGVRVRLPEPLPGHRQPLHVHPLHHWQQQEQLSYHEEGLYWPTMKLSVESYSVLEFRIVYLFTIHVRDVIFIHLYLKVSILGEGNRAKLSSCPVSFFVITE